MSYHDFLWKINYSNSLYVKPSEQETVYKAYIGFGNNSNMVKSILKRRCWWTVTDKVEGSNFAWSQLKINTIFREYQNPSKTKLEAIYECSPELPDNMKTEPIAKLQEGH